MKGIDFIANTRLSSRGDVTLAEKDATCENVPVASLPGLYASGKIRAAVIDEAERTARAKAKRVKSVGRPAVDQADGGGN